MTNQHGRNANEKCEKNAAGDNQESVSTILRPIRIVDQSELSTNQNRLKPNKVASNHLTEKEKLIMNGAIGRVQEKEEDEEPEETSGPKPILPYTSMFVFRSEDQIRVACHYIGIVAIP